MFTRLLSVCAALCLGMSVTAACSDRSAERAAEAERVRAEAAAKEEIRAKAVAAAEAERLKALWTYGNEPFGNGRQTTAYILSTNDIDTGGGSGRVQLVFRDHTAWGRSSYLVLTSGDFDCYSGCTVAVSVDGGESKKMAGRRPRTDDAIAMFINDWKTMWSLTAAATRLTVEFPLQAGGTQTATFDVAGLDAAKMAWSAN